MSKTRIDDMRAALRADRAEAREEQALREQVAQLEADLEELEAREPEPLPEELTKGEQLTRMWEADPRGTLAQLVANGAVADAVDALDPDQLRRLSAADWRAALEVVGRVHGSAAEYRFKQAMDQAEQADQPVRYAPSGAVDSTHRGSWEMAEQKRLDALPALDVAAAIHAAEESGGVIAFDDLLRMSPEQLATVKQNKALYARSLEAM